MFTPICSTCKLTMSSSCLDLNNDSKILYNGCLISNNVQNLVFIIPFYCKCDIKF